jgi:predicted NAD/FAD-binding protein
MRRRKFIQSALGIMMLPAVLPACNTSKSVKGRIVGASAERGHLLRNGLKGEPVETTEKKLVIVGGGISGLSAARELHRQGIADFVLLELEDRTGGNATWDANEVSAYPWGAHYIPIPNNDLSEYISFLKECGVITGTDAAGLPVYNEFYLCFDPEERLYINGTWQEGLVPRFGVPDKEKKQIADFLALMQVMREAKGMDGKFAFAIPVDQSSSDTSYTALDGLTMQQWMREKGFTSRYLDWYVNYCMRDDYGTPIHIVSAWAGIHYFASRKGQGANAGYHDVLTWPEGNGWLVQQLQKNIESNISTQCLVGSVREREQGVEVIYLDVKQNRLKSIIAEQCIIAAPQFIASRLLNDERRRTAVNTHLQYVPWMVANLKVLPLEERSGAAKSWDNVIYESNSLGYVDATHELLQMKPLKRNLTFYYPLTGDTPANERKKAQARTHSEWAEIVFSDLRKVHPDIEAATEELNIMVWGHAMAQPLPGLIYGKTRNELAQSVGNKIHFAHSDLAGISIFEEAFYQGLEAAKKVIKNIS